MKHLILALLIAPSVALAEIRYLDCFVTSEKEERKDFSVAIDESSSKVTHTNEASSSVQNAVFTSSTITYKQDIASSGLEVYFQYEISRVDLSVIQLFYIAPRNKEFLKDMPPEKVYTKGKCEIQKPVERLI